MSFSLDNFLEGGAETGHPKKTRKLSLEEAILTKHLEQDSPPVTRSRGVILILHYVMSCPILVITFINKSVI